MANLKGLPKKARALSGSGRLPDVANLVDKTPEELVRTLRRYGIDPDIKGIDRAARRAYLQLEEVVDSGKEPDAATWERIAKQQESDITRQLRRMTKRAIQLHEQGKVGSLGPKQFLMWVTRSDDRVCPSCEPRHGQKATMAQWEQRGLPGDSVLVCSADCRCRLVPVTA